MRRSRSLPTASTPTCSRPTPTAGACAELGVSDKFVVTYAGALGMANDIDTILRAAARLRADARIRFLLVGEGKERLNLEAKAKRFELANLKFVGTRTKSAMAAMLAASDACVATLKNIPMFRTTYPNKVFDYMAAARPTILAIDGVIRQVVEAAGGGIFVPPGDDRALAAAAQKLCDDPASCRAMGSAARRYVVEHFNRREQAQDFVRLVERLAKPASTENDEPPIPEVRQTCA